MMIKNKYTIWIDISNSPHVLMFEDMIQDFKQQGAQVIVTSRPLANTLDLLNQKYIDNTVIGEHYGKSLVNKIMGFPVRCFQLYRFLKNKQVDIAISQSSFHSPVVAKMLGIPSIYMNDNEHAFGNLAAILCASKLYFPESMKRRSWLFKLPGVKKKTRIYPGIKESVYLWRKMEKNIHHNYKTHPPYNIYVRPEPRTAQYYKGGENFLDESINQLKEKNHVVVLARDKHQLAHYREPKFKGVEAPDKPVQIDSILKDCDLFIGAGGSMTRELAIMGVPTLSVYQDELLGVDQYLIDEGYMAHTKKMEKTEVGFLISLLDKNKKEDSLVEKGKQAYEMIIEEVMKLGRTS